MNKLVHRFTSLVIAFALTFSPIFASLSRAASMTDYLENKLVDALFRGVSYTMPTALAIALHTAACSDSSAGTEVANSGSYSRQALNPSTTNWAATNSAGSTANPSAGTSGTTSNNSTITFSTATGNWGTVTHFSVWDSATYGGGNMLFCAALTSSQTINTGATPSFSAGSLTVQIDN